MLERIALSSPDPVCIIKPQVKKLNFQIFNSPLSQTNVAQYNHYIYYNESFICKLMIKAKREKCSRAYDI